MFDPWRLLGAHLAAGTTIICGAIVGVVEILCG